MFLIIKFFGASASSSSNSLKTHRPLSSSDKVVDMYKMRWSDDEGFNNDDTDISLFRGTAALRYWFYSSCHNRGGSSSLLHLYLSFPNVFIVLLLVLSSSFPIVDPTPSPILIYLFHISCLIIQSNHGPFSPPHVLSWNLLSRTIRSPSPFDESNKVFRTRSSGSSSLPSLKI